jgi:hypothetical protein
MLHCALLFAGLTQFGTGTCRCLSLLQGKAPKRPRRTAKDPEAAAAADAAKRQVAGQVARDQHLSVYHAVGKLLHYKRQQPGEQQQGEGGSSQQQQQQQHAGAGAGSSKKAKQQEDGGGSDSDVEIIDAAASQQEQQTNSRWVKSVETYHIGTPCLLCCRTAFTTARSA